MVKLISAHETADNLLSRKHTFVDKQWNNEIYRISLRPNWRVQRVIIFDLIQLLDRKFVKIPNSRFVNG